MDTPTIADWVSQHETAVRLGAFALTFLAVALWELAAPQRELTLPRAVRWRANLGLVLLNTVLLRVVFPTAAVGVAAVASAQGWGVLNVWQPPLWAAVLLAVVALDFVVWLQHVMVHAVPALWRLHRVHHADLDYDLTTGARFHPMEIGLSMGIKFAAIVLLGAPVLAVMVFEVLLSSCAMFNHGNIRLSARADRVLRWFMVTPDMHRVHHSVEDDESNCNFGFNLTWWDRLLGTYREQPRAGQQGMTIGIRDHGDPQEVARLGGMLRLPFVAANEGYAINRRDWTPPP
ncbi:MAG: sterol desaturase family protein [Burkholderiaceae bacterium]|nr:sterol desaturase family protein [Burkholderiaceae bacterium]